MCKLCCNKAVNASRAKDPSVYRKQNLDYYYKNKDALNEYRRAKWPEVYEQTIEYQKAKHKKYQKENPDKIREFARRRRAKKVSNGFEKYTEAQVLELHGPTCHLCQQPIDLSLPRKIGVEGWRDSLQIDHVIPLAKGGPDTLANVKPSHARCNIAKSDKL
jgi:5-methylcytosine-specific restriction endonuclease McrA